MNELEQLKAKYQELGAVIERMEKGEAEFNELKNGFWVNGNGDVNDENSVRHVNASWNVMPTKEDAQRLGKIFQAVAEQEHLMRHLNEPKFIHMQIVPKPYDPKGYINSPLQACLGAYRSLEFSNKEILEKAVKLASPNLLAYWKGEL